MKITEAIVQDLMPAYLSGEASRDTENLVDVFYKENPELANKFNHVSLKTMHNTFEVKPLKDEIKLLKRTKNMLKLRTLFFVLAILFSTLPFAFGDVSWDDIQGAHWLWQNNPMGAFICGGFAIVFWLAFYNIQRRLNVTGL